jgi:hypothetical protein
MDTKLGDLYGEIFKKSFPSEEATVVTESSKSGTVDGSKVKAGAGFEGAEKVKQNSVESGPEGKGNKVAKPTEGPSSDDEAAKPKPLGKKETGGMKDSDDKEAKMKLSFDDLYKKTITENEDEIVSTPDLEGEGFDEKTGDFEGGEEGAEGSDEANEEIDLASELRLLADRLTEIADKFSVEESGEEGAEGDIDAIGDELPPVEGAPENGGEMARESVQQVKEAIKSEPTPKPAKKTTLGPKMSQNPKASGYTKKSGAGKAQNPKMGKDWSGRPSNAAKTTLGPKMSQNPSGTGPAVKAGNAPLVA